MPTATFQDFRFRVGAVFRQRRIRYVVSALAVLSLLVGYCWFLLTLPPSRISVVLSGHTQFVRYQVVNPAFSSFWLSGMRAEGGGALNGSCINAMVTPERGSIIEYWRGNDAYYRVNIRPSRQSSAAFSLRENGGESRLIAEGVVFRVAKGDGRCPSDSAPYQLPIWGPAQFGDKRRAPGEDGRLTGALMDGTISVYARAQEKLLGFRFPSSIYLVNSFDLPPWSVLSTRADAVKDTSLNAGESTGTMPPDVPNGAAWIGSVEIETDTAGFAVSASSQARHFSLMAPSLGSNQAGSQDDLDLGNYAQFMNDPNVIQVQVVGGAIVFLLQGLCSILSFLGLFPSQSNKT